MWLCHCDILYVGRTTQRLQERIKQYVPKPLRQTTTPTQVEGNPPIPTNQNTAKQKNVKQKVRLNSNQRAIQPLANICWNPISAHATILLRGLKS